MGQGEAADKTAAAGSAYTPPTNGLLRLGLVADSQPHHRVGVVVVESKTGAHDGVAVAVAVAVAAFSANNHQFPVFAMGKMTRAVVNPGWLV